MNQNKEQYAKAVSLFLAELLRTRRIKLDRAAEIAQKVTENINLIDTEEQFLKFIKELTTDFQELFQLGEQISLRMQHTTRRNFEQKVREFVASILPKDSKLAYAVLQEAISEKCEIDHLCAKFPEFNEFINPKI